MEEINTTTVDSDNFKNQSFKDEENTNNLYISSSIVEKNNGVFCSFEQKPIDKILDHLARNGGSDIQCLPGYRFNPFDHELLIHYLQPKVNNQPLPHYKIREVELYKYNPEDITQEKQGLVDNEWYFFTPRNRKYRNGERPDRAAGYGYWKATGADKDVKYKGAVVGHRKALVYYRGKAPRGVKTNWIMHEFRVPENKSNKKQSRANDMRLDDWVLCWIYKKDGSFRKAPKQNHTGPNMNSPQVASAAASAIDERGCNFPVGNNYQPLMINNNGPFVNNFQPEPRFTPPSLPPPPPHVNNSNSNNYANQSLVEADHEWGEEEYLYADFYGGYGMPSTMDSILYSSNTDHANTAQSNTDQINPIYSMSPQVNTWPHHLLNSSNLLDYN